MTVRAPTASSIGLLLAALLLSGCSPLILAVVQATEGPRAEPAPAEPASAASPAR